MLTLASEITDADGNLLFNINQQVLTIGKTFVGADKVGTEVLRLKKKMSRE
jgi:uncharacterized protein YxjI